MWQWRNLPRRGSQLVHSVIERWQGMMYWHRKSPRYRFGSPPPNNPHTIAPGPPEVYSSYQWMHQSFTRWWWRWWSWNVILIAWIPSWQLDVEPNTETRNDMYDSGTLSQSHVRRMMKNIVCVWMNRYCRNESNGLLLCVCFDCSIDAPTINTEVVQCAWAAYTQNIYGWAMGTWYYDFFTSHSALQL